MKHRSRVLIGGILLSTSSLVLAGPDETFKDIRFPYHSREMQEWRVKYGKDFMIHLDEVNRLDYDYEISIEAEAPRPVPAPGPRPGPPGTPNKTGVPCSKVANPMLVERLKLFGTDALDGWLEEMKKLDCDHAEEMRAKLEARAKELGPHKGVLPIPRDRLASYVEQTGPGGALIIRVVATASLTEIEELPEPDGNNNLRINRLKPIPPGKLMQADDVKAAVAQHTRERVYKVIFEREGDVEFSFGPHVSGIERREFGRVSNPGFGMPLDPADPSGPTDDREFLIDTTEDSSFSYGIAAFWTVMPWEKRRMKVGLSWGVAYNLDNQVETQVSGLLGLTFRSGGSALLLHVGVAIGRENELAGGRTLMGTGVGASEEIPQRTKLTAGPMFSLSFRFGN